MTHITQVTVRSSVYSYRFLTMILAACALLFLQSNVVQAQWSNGANINNTNNGTVSVGTTNPGGDKLIIAGNTVGGNVTTHTQLHSTFDTQSNVIMELSYGTATANITPYPTIVLSKNLTSTNNLLGAFNFANRSIANGSEKRIASIAAWTDGATNSGALVFSTASAGTVNESMRLTSGGSLGIGTATPSTKLDVAGTSKSLAFNLNGQSAEKAFPMYWNNAVANQKVQVYWPASTQVDGIYEITVTGHYWFSNSNGGIRKRIVINGRDIGIINMQESEVPFRLGYTGNSNTISNIMWDAANSRYYFIVSNLDNAQNGITIHVKSITPGATPANADNLNISSIYTTDATNYPQLFTSFMSSNVGIGTNTPGYKLDVNGEVNATGFRINGTPISGGGGAVSSVFGRTGAVVAASNDYTWAQINKSTSSLADLQTRSAGDLSSGTLLAARMPGLTGDVTSSAGGVATTLANTAVTPGSYTSANITVESKGRITAASTGSGGSSQWSGAAGSNIYYNSGNVGIGTASPTAQLHVAGANGLANNTAAPATDALKVVGGIGGNGTWGGSQGGVGGGMSFAGGTGGTPVAGSQSALGGKGGSINLVGGGGGPNVFAVGGGAGGDVSINGGAGVANSDGNIFLADLRGKVGIGTASPGAVLEVRKDQNASTDIYLNNATAGSGTGAYTGLRFYQGTTLKAFVGSANSGSSGYTGGANALQIWNMQNAPMVFGTNGLERMRIDAAGNVGIGTTPNSSYKLDVFGSINVSGNINAKYQDMAEWVESSQVLTAGTVVVLDQTKSNQVIASSQAYDTRVAGVISLRPGITLGEKGESKVLVATTGRVRIKVDASRGSIQVGDLLVTSGVSGLAMKSQPIDVGGVKIHRPGTLIGKALEPLEQGVGEILVLLSLQ